MNKMYAVNIECEGVENERSSNYFIFSTEKKALRIMNRLFSKRFEETENWEGNPFAGMDDDERKDVLLAKYVTKVVDGCEYVERFVLNDRWTAASLSVWMEEIEIDMPEDECNY